MASRTDWVSFNSRRRVCWTASEEKLTGTCRVSGPPWSANSLEQGGGIGEGGHVDGLQLGGVGASRHAVALDQEGHDQAPAQVPHRLDRQPDVERLLLGQGELDHADPACQGWAPVRRLLVAEILSPRRPPGDAGAAQAAEVGRGRDDSVIDQVGDHAHGDVAGLDLAQEELQHLLQYGQAERLGGEPGRAGHGDQIVDVVDAHREVGGPEPALELLFDVLPDAALLGGPAIAQLDADGVEADQVDRAGPQDPRGADALQRLARTDRDNAIDAVGRRGLGVVVGQAGGDGGGHGASTIRRPP